MSFRNILTRLRLLEERTAQATTDDLASRREQLALTCDDDRAMALYNEFLTSLSGTCVHESLGSCPTCFSDRQKSKEVRLALSRLEEIIRVLMPVPTSTKEQ